MRSMTATVLQLCGSNAVWDVSAATISALNQCLGSVRDEQQPMILDTAEVCLDCQPTDDNPLGALPSRKGNEFGAGVGLKTQLNNGTLF